MSQSDSLWIDLYANLANVFLNEHYCSYNILNQLRFPDEQDPQMIMLIGSESKTKAIRRLEPSLNSNGNHNKIHLRLAPGNTKVRSPILLADCELHNDLLPSKSLGTPSVPSVEHHPLLWHQKVRTEGPDANKLAYLVYAKLMCPFSTIVCLFADDLGGTAAVANLLASWLINSTYRSSDLPISTYPRILVLKADHRTPFNEEKATLEFMKELAEEAKVRNRNLGQEPDGRPPDHDFDALLRQYFGGLRVLTLPNNPAVPEESEILKLENLWESLRARILQGSQRIQDRRRKAQVAFSATHFKAFFHLACTHFAGDIITPFSFLKASRLANPIPQDFASHISNFLAKIKPSLVDSFAIPFIASAMTLDSYPPGMHIFPPEQVFQHFYANILDGIQVDKEKIEDLFCQQVLENSSEFIDTAKSHQAVLSRFSKYRRSTFNNRTCLSCIARPPENNTLDCGHSFCDDCVVIHGRTGSEEPWNFILPICPLCEAPNGVRILRKPYTAGIRAFSISGQPGDVSAINFLKMLHARLPLPKMNIREHFDIAIGTGAGAPIVAGLFCKGLSLEQSIKLSKNSAYARSLCQPFTPRHYSSTRINSVFKKALGLDKTLFECSGSNTKSAIAVSKDLSTYIFSNYNGPTRRPSVCGHTLLRPENSKDEIPLWKAGRAGSAAPPSLKAFQGCHGLEDQPKLTSLILWEQNFLWTRKDKNPDISLSLGARIEVTTTAGKDLWLQTQPLDTLIRFCTDSIMASLFYMELAGLPLPNNIGFACRVNIRCRLLPSEPHLKTLAKQLWDRQARFYYNFGMSIPCIDLELLEDVKDGLSYSRPIEINIRSLGDVIDAKVDGITKRARSISNCPYIVRDIIKDQGLHCFFGHKNHQRRDRMTSR